MPTVEASGITIYYEVHGTGEPFVLIAGLLIDLTALEGIVSQLSQRYRVIAFDNRGSGRSDKPDIPYLIEMMADDTAGPSGSTEDCISLYPRHFTGRTHSRRSHLEASGTSQEFDPRLD